MNGMSNAAELAGGRANLFEFNEIDRNESMITVSLNKDFARTIANILKVNSRTRGMDAFALTLENSVYVTNGCDPGTFPSLKHVEIID